MTNHNDSGLPDRMGDRGRIIDALVGEIIKGRRVWVISVSELASISHLTRPAFYKAFPKGRDESILHAYTKTADQLFDLACNTCTQCDENDPIVRLQATLEAIAGWVQANPGLATLMLIDIIMLGDPGLDAQTKLNTRFANTLQALLTDQADTPRDPAKTQATAELLVGAIKHLLIHQTTTSHQQPPTTWIPTICQLANTIIS